MSFEHELSTKEYLSKFKRYLKYLIMLTITVPFLLLLIPRLFICNDCKKVHINCYYRNLLLKKCHNVTVVKI